MYIRDTWTYFCCGMIYCAVEMIRGISGDACDPGGDLGLGLNPNLRKAEREADGKLVKRSY